MNRLALALAILGCAILTSILGSLFFPDTTPKTLSAKKRIFVLLVAYKNANWVNVLDELMRNASHPDRITVGVVEYVQKARDSLEDRVPMHLHSAVRTFTVSARTAKTLQNARKLGMKKLYHDEDYVLFTNDVVLVLGWDELLCEMIDERSVVSTRPPMDEHPRFVTIPSPETLRYRKMKLQSREPVPALVWSPEFSFSTGTLARTLCDEESAWAVTDRLVREGAVVVEPARLVAQTVETTQLRVSKSRREFDAFWTSSGLKEHPDRAKLGLTPRSTHEEKIAKFGSIAAARIAIQDLTV